jgi:phosphatidylglycerophosphatase C
MQRIAIYDLDRTLLRKPTFTPFLLFAAARAEPWRLLMLPVWIAAMIGYRIGFYGRKPLKQFGLHVFAGRHLKETVYAPIVRDFAIWRVRSDYTDIARQSVEAHRKEGAIIVIATAAPEIYATEIGRILNIEHVIATRHLHAPDRNGALGYFAKIDGENCYGPEKLRRTINWLQAQGLPRSGCEIVAYSDHPSDAPMFDWSDQAIMITTNPRLIAAAKDNGWTAANFG